MITYGLGSLMLLTMGLGVAWLPSGYYEIVPPEEKKLAEIEFINIKREITFEEVK